MAISNISLPNLFNCFVQLGHLIYEINLDIYTFVDLKSNTFATFDFRHNLCTVYNEPGILYRFKKDDFNHALEKYKKHVYKIEELNDTSNSMKPGTRFEEKGHTHPNNYQIPALEGLTNWVLLECGDAVRYYNYCDNNLYGSRAAYVSKSARIRVKDNQWKTVGGRSSDYGLSLDNLLACDEELIKLGFFKKES